MIKKKIELYPYIVMYWKTPKHNKFDILFVWYGFERINVFGDEDNERTVHLSLISLQKE